MKYDFTAIEQKWQKIWQEKNLYASETGSAKEKFYALIEFPYPSGVGLHVGHARPYTAMDTIAIFPLKRSRPAMKNEASIPLFLCVQCIQTTFGQHLILF